MYDIKFFKETEKLKKSLLHGELSIADMSKIEAELDMLISKQPHIFNFETTNHCNMTCIFCPRTTLMTRDISWIDDQTFESVLDQMSTHSESDLEEFWKFIKEEYGITFSEKSENAFYFYIVSRCLILHGYGEPLVDKNIVTRVQACTDRNIPTYFSCVPANLSVKRAQSIMEAGLSVLKVSIDGLDDDTAKNARGRHNNFDKAYQTILEVLELKKEKGYKTLIVPCMIALGESEDHKAKHKKFMDLWEGKDVYAYVKSQDNRWYYEEDSQMENKSHYEQQYCEFPWTSMSVMAEGDVVPCCNDYNNEMKLGNVKEQSIQEIWEGDKYKQLREWHLKGNFPKGHKCFERCDQKKLFQIINKNS